MFKYLENRPYPKCIQGGILVLSNKNIKSLKDLFRNYPLDEDEIELIGRIDISNNNLETLEDLPYFPNLRVLYCDVNKICSLECLERYPKLEEISCSYNLIESFEGVSSIKSLKKLNCHSNKIKSFKNLGFCENLEILSCYCNQIETFNHFKTNNFPKLKYFEYFYKDIKYFHNYIDNPIATIFFEKSKNEIFYIIDLLNKVQNYTKICKVKSFLRKYLKYKLDIN
jgi:hypothetical protein